MIENSENTQAKANLIVPKKPKYLYRAIALLIVGTAMVVSLFFDFFHKQVGAGLGFAILGSGFLWVIGGVYFVAKFTDSFDQIHIWKRIGLPAAAFPQNLTEIDAAKILLCERLHQQAALVASLRLVAAAIGQMYGAQMTNLINLGQTKPWSDFERSVTDWREERQSLIGKLSKLRIWRTSADWQQESATHLLIAAKDTFVDSWQLSAHAGFESAGELIKSNMSLGIERCLARSKENDRKHVESLMEKAGLTVDHEVFQNISLSEPSQLDSEGEEQVFLPG